MCKELLFEDRDGVVIEECLQWPEYADEKNPGRLMPAREFGNHINGGTVYPLKIIQNHDQGFRFAQCLQRVQHLAQHASTGCRSDVELQVDTLFTTEKIRELDDAGGSLRLEHLYDRFAFGLAQLGDRLENREVGFLNSVPFDALAPGRVRNLDISDSTQEPST